jgi:5-methylcytosine-specific restriction endonuclease McrA
MSKLRHEKVCEICGNKYIAKISTAKYCSKSCQQSNWLKSDTFKKSSRKNSLKSYYKDTRKWISRVRKWQNENMPRKGICKKTFDELFERDNGECRSCGSVENIHIHHIDGVGRHHRDRGLGHLVNDHIDNLMLLCNRCHGAHHGAGRLFDH